MASCQSAWRKQKKKSNSLNGLTPMTPGGSLVAPERRGHLFHNFQSISNNLCQFQLASCRIKPSSTRAKMRCFRFFSGFKLPVFRYSWLALTYSFKAGLWKGTICFCDCDGISQQNCKPLVSKETSGDVVFESFWCEGKMSTLDGVIGPRN